MSTLSPWPLAADILDPAPWTAEGRADLLPHQRTPDWDWYLWILFGGRGSGKTEGACREFLRRIHASPIRARIIGPTFGDVVDSCVEGNSGILAMDPTATFRPSAPGGAQITWPNGSRARLIGVPTPREVDRLRAAGNVHLDWWEEAAAIPVFEKAWAQAIMGNRLGPHPLAIMSTTPRVRPFLKTLLARETTAVTRGRMDDNPHITVEVRDELRRMYAGTRIGRQELEGELLDDIPGALWTLEIVENARTLPEPLPTMMRVVVAVDPATTTTEGSDETGIVVVARGSDDRGYVIADYSGVYTTGEWARRVLFAFDHHQADLIVAERNNGGDMIRDVIHTRRATAPVELVWASRGKRIRAEPIANLYEQQRAGHYPGLVQLEEQMTSWDASDPEADSPDRVDALVWGWTALGFVNPPIVTGSTHVLSTLPDGYTPT